MRDYAAGLVALVIPALCSGCMSCLPSDQLSSLLLNPDTTCEQLADSLELGTLPSASTPADAGLEFDALTVTSANGQALSAWYVPAQWDGQLDADPAGTVLIMHGTDGTISCVIPWVLAAVSNHMHTVVFDYQGFGSSGGVPDLATQLDDSEALLNWILADDSQAHQQVHLLGTSLGTGSALGLVALRTRPQIRSVALDGTYDPEAILAFAESVVGPLFPIFESSARVGIAWVFEMRDRLGDVTAPVMFIHAEDDLLTPLSGAQIMRGLVGSSANTLWVFKDLTHIQPLFRERDAYMSLLVTFWRDPAVEPSATASTTDDTIRVPSFDL